MNFWAQQADARRRSRWLLFLFMLAVLGVALAVNLVVLVMVVASAQEPTSAGVVSWPGASPRTIAITTLSVLAIIGISTLIKAAKLSKGGSAVARTLGGRRVQADTTDPAERRLLHIVDEMAIAAGLPTPAVYVLEAEEGINAFAAGHSPANAAIAVTRGTLRELNRAELQGVVGHEFGHILNGDMRLNIRLISLLSGLMIISIAGRTLQQAGLRSRELRKGATPVLAVALALMGIGYVGVFFGRLIQAAVSRQREFLADASSVQFTRHPEGLRDALLKIGQLTSSRIRHPRAEEVAHMLFAPGLTRWFATHPPLAKRIKALDASFDIKAARLRLEVRPQPLGIVEAVAGGSAAASLSDPAFLARQSIPLDPAKLRQRVGNPTAADVARASLLSATLPVELLASDQAATTATARVLALVLDTDPGVRGLQLQKIGNTFGTTLDTALQEELEALRKVPPEQRLALLGRIIPILQQQPETLRLQILDTLAMLARADGIISVFEYALGTLARTYLGETLDHRRQGRRLRLASASVELQILFATLARHGHASEEQAREAYARGMAHLGLPKPPPWRVQAGWAAGLDRALRCLDRLDETDKERVVEALAATIVHDGRITVAEGELLRAICAALHCPLPPLHSG